jgi:hypothetical protein
MEAHPPAKIAGGGDGVEEVPNLEDALQHFAVLVAAYYDSEGPHAALLTAAAPAPHAVLQAVLDTYERCKGSDGGEVVVNATTDGIVHEHLQRIGFVRAPAPDGAPSPGVSMMTMKLAHHEQLEAFEVTKSRARSEYHARRAQQHEADFIGQLASLFDMRHIVHNEDDPGETLFFPEEEEAHRGAAPFPLEQAKASLAAFVQRYHKVIDHTPHAVVLYPLSLTLTHHRST